MIKNSVRNESWDRRLWSKEEKTFPGIYQNPRGCFCTTLTLPPKYRILHHSFSCFTYHCKYSSSSWNICSASTSLGTKFILQVSTHMLPSPGSLPVPVLCQVPLFILLLTPCPLPITSYHVIHSFLILDIFSNSQLSDPSRVRFSFTLMYQLIIKIKAIIFISSDHHNVCHRLNTQKVLVE